MQRAVAAAAELYGKLDLAWSNAGIGVFKTVPETDEDEADRIVAVNLKGAYLVGKYAIPEIMRAGGGTVVITASVNAIVADRKWAAYCATKGGVLMLARAMSLDHATDGVRVDSRLPGISGHRAAGKLAPGPVGHRLRGRSGGRPGLAHPLGRYATAEEVARAALFLSCGDSSFTTGSALMVDGGLSAQ